MITIGGCGKSGKGSQSSPSPPADMAIITGLPATQLVSASGIIHIYDADDTQAIYAAPDSSLDSVALARGAPTLIARYSDFAVTFSGARVGSWQFSQTVPPAGGMGFGWQSGTLTLWTPGGSQDLGLTVPEGALALSDDGTLAAYLDHTSADGSSADLYLASLDGNAAPLLLLAAIDPDAQLLFAGTRLVIRHGAPGSDPNNWNLSVADPNGNVAALGSGIYAADEVVISSDGTRVIAFSYDAKKLRSYPLDGSPPVDLDTYQLSTQEGTFDDRVGIPIGDDVLYFADLSFRRVPAAGGAVRHLAVGQTLAGLSPDKSRFATVNWNDKQGNNEGTLTVTSLDGITLATAQGIAVSGTAMDITQFPEVPNMAAFTADSRYVLYFSAGDSQAPPPSWGVLHSLDTATNQTAKLAERSLFVATLEGDRFVSGEVEGDGMTNDVVLHDAAGAQPPVVLAHAVHSWVVTPDKTRLVYSTSTGASPGLYVLTLPSP
jgi:hypothetical protein